MLKKIYDWVKNNLIQFLQIACYSVSILLVFDENPNLAAEISEVVLISLSVLIKLIRLIKQRKLKKLLSAQMAFYIPYLLMAFQLIFFIKGVKGLITQTQITISVSLVVVKNVAYSMLLEQHLCSYVELFAYSVGEIIHIVKSTLATIQLVELFDFYEVNDYAKDMLLLFTAAGIALATMIMDLLYRVYEKKSQKQKIQKESVLIELGKV